MFAKLPKSVANRLKFGKLIVKIGKHTFSRYIKFSGHVLAKRLQQQSFAIFTEK